MALTHSMKQWARTGHQSHLPSYLWLGYFSPSAVFPAIFVYFILNLIFGRSQMIQSISAPQKIKVHRTGMRQQMIKNQGASTSSGHKQITTNETLFSSSPRQSSKNQDYCKKCYGALNPAGKCPQCNY